MARREEVGRLWTAADFWSSDKALRGIRVDPERWGDFRELDGGWQFDAPFVGPYEVSVKGKAVGPNTHPTFHACLEDAAYLRVRFDFSSTSTIDEVDSDSYATLDSDTGYINVTRPYVIDLKVGETAISAYANGTRLLQAEKDSKRFGPFALIDFEKVRKVVVAGEVDPEWIPRRIADAIESARKTHAATFDVDAALPEWLREGSGSRSDGSQYGGSPVDPESR